MGDNRNFSSDLRVFGLVPRKNILAKAILRIWPIGQFGGLGSGPTLDSPPVRPSRSQRSVLPRSRPGAGGAGGCAELLHRTAGSREPPRLASDGSAAHPRGIGGAPLDQVRRLEEERNLLLAASR